LALLISTKIAVSVSASKKRKN